MPGIPREQLNKPFRLGEPQERGDAPAQSQPAKPAPALATPAPRPTVPANNSQLPEIRTAGRTQISKTILAIESKPLSAYDDNVVLTEQGAAFIVGVSADLLKKWRQRNQGPDYLQYGKDGPVRYELKALLDFRDGHRICLPKR
jgi:hypothetical protein